MTVIRLFCCLFLLCLCVLPVCAEPSLATAPQELVRLQQENSALQRKVRRLEAQVTAMREELNTPGLSEVAGGIGYIVGIFGAAAWFAARKKEGQGS